MQAGPPRALNCNYKQWDNCFVRSSLSSSAPRNPKTGATSSTAAAAATTTTAVDFLLDGRWPPAQLHCGQNILIVIIQRIARQTVSVNMRIIIILRTTRSINFSFTPEWRQFMGQVINMGILQKRRRRRCRSLPFRLS